jgi:hypothetical protein
MVYCFIKTIYMKMHRIYWQGQDWTRSEVMALTHEAHAAK